MGKTIPLELSELCRVDSLNNMFHTKTTINKHYRLISLQIQNDNKSI